MSGPRVDQVNVVVDDVAAAAHFLTELGVDLPAAPEGWEAHHRSIPTATSSHGGHDRVDPAFDVDLDSSVFARWWGALAPSFNGVVINLRVDERSDVDQLHERAIAVGGATLKAPYDAFWGARFAVVEGPGPLAIGIMSVPDPALRTLPPDPSSLQ